MQTIDAAERLEMTPSCPLLEAWRTWDTWEPVRAAQAFAVAAPLKVETLGAPPAAKGRK